MRAIGHGQRPAIPRTGPTREPEAARLSGNSSVTQWIDGLKRGDPAATRALWQRFVHEMARFADRKLKGNPGIAVAGSDVAQEAWLAFFQAAQKGMFPRLEDRNDLWTLLLLLTERKARDHGRRHRAARRPTYQDVTGLGGNLADVPGNSAAFPDPAGAAAAAEMVEILLGLLDPKLRQLAILKMQGYSHDEISQSQDCAAVTVSRRLALIRARWQTWMDVLDAEISR